MDESHSDCYHPDSIGALSAAALWITVFGHHSPTLKLGQVQVFVDLVIALTLSWCGCGTTPKQQSHSMAVDRWHANIRVFLAIDLSAHSKVNAGTEIILSRLRLIR